MPRTELDLPVWALYPTGRSEGLIELYVFKKKKKMQAALRIIIPRKAC